MYFSLQYLEQRNVLLYIVLLYIVLLSETRTFFVTWDIALISALEILLLKNAFML